MPEIETDRLLLRQFTPGDLDALAGLFADPDVVRYLGSGLPASREEAETALRSIIAHWERHRFGRWAAVYRATGEVIGYGGLRSFHGEPELVYLLGKSYWRRGLATEMALACIKFGFEELEFDRVIAMAKTGNRASHRVLEKTGMRFERAANIYGMDVVCYGLSRAAYLSGRAARTLAYHLHCLSREARQGTGLQA